MGTIEWEGTAERIAFHAPYILIFDSRFIEIRHIETGLLVQIIPGSDVRCICDGRGVSTSSVSPFHEDSQEAQLHVVMNATDSTNGPDTLKNKSIVQHVCELIPTVSPQSTTSPRGYTTSVNSRFDTDFTSLGSAYATSYYPPSGPVPYVSPFNIYPSSSTNNNIDSLYGSHNTISYISFQSQSSVSLTHSNRTRSSGSGGERSGGFF